MTVQKSPERTETPLTQDLLYAAQYYLGERRGWILLAIGALGVGAVLSWSWLVAIGIAPLLLAVAPCAAMCALGLCMNRAMGKPCSKNSGGTDQSPSAVKADPTGTRQSHAGHVIASGIAPSQSPTSIPAVAVGSKQSKSRKHRRS